MENTTGFHARKAMQVFWKQDSGPGNKTEFPGNNAGSQRNMAGSPASFPTYIVSMVPCFGAGQTKAGCRKSMRISGGMWCLPAHLCGAGSPARVLNTRPTIPGGGQVPGTPKGPRGSRQITCPALRQAAGRFRAAACQLPEPAGAISDRVKR